MEANGAFRVQEDLFLDEQEGGGVVTGLLSSLFGGATTNVAAVHRCASFSIKAFPRSNCLPFLGRPQDGKSVPAYIKGPSRFDPLALSKAFFSHLKDNEIPSFLINVNDSGKLLLVENGRRFEALSIQLVILAIWKQALHICHAEAASAGRQSFRRGQNLGGNKAGPENGSIIKAAYGDALPGKQLLDSPYKIQFCIAFQAYSLTFSQET